MSKITTIEYPSWQQFKHDLVPELFTDEVFRSGVYLFRGMGNADWDLSPAFDRRFRDLPSRDRLALWYRLLGAFREACEAAGISSEILQDERRLIAFGQHYGLPTRLLDWTLSPYVAAFFAFRHVLAAGADALGHIAIWVLHTGSSVWSPDTGVEIVSAPAVENMRLRNQSGRFTLARTPFANLEQYVESCEGEELALTRIILPASEAHRAVPDLDAMGINSAHLFPDMAGLTEGVTMRALFQGTSP
jgi:FRG domain